MSGVLHPDAHVAWATQPANSHYKHLAVAKPMAVTLQKPNGMIDWPKASFAA
ncbi:hypothetical protein RRU01S_44_00050 [Agrobacterium rubi TR3 = NBRC 13261]|uniref:Uncharacterized protein n=1 Tax=Agrobacterium rubi TR3 = NBRC 13261 TaxID=1368415 RepID=A0A081D3J0_9HYPH|nr:hypothetical protein [Agrobacterium rubi]MBP1881703.1 hypothetical protein [Agrobacterium rubi]GAK73486.1 hypothetical protein RRU01S_44_00050 [Agrobacterium rubi TR3 = NBRC 13261]